jgi:DNA gyrase subunit A
LKVTAIADYVDVLDDEARVDEIIIKELEIESAKHSCARRAAIVRGDDLDATNIDELSLIANDQCVIVMTAQGYIKRMLTTEFESQNRGTRGKRGVGNVRDKDIVSDFFSCNTHDMLVAISKQGIAYGLPAHKVPIGSRTSRGAPIFQLLPEIGAGKTMASVLPVSEFRDDEFVALLTKKGLLKKTAMSAFNSINARGKIIIGLRDGDELKWVRRCTADDTMIIGSKLGYALRFELTHKSLRSSGRGSMGVRSMFLRAGDEIVDMDVLRAPTEEEEEQCYVLAVTSDGLGKRVLADDFGLRRRGTRGLIAAKFKSVGGAGLVALRACGVDDSVMLATEQGTIVRQKVERVRAMSRTARPILLQRIDSGDAVAAVTILPGTLLTAEEKEEDLAASVDMHDEGIIEDDEEDEEAEDDDDE